MLQDKVVLVTGASQGLGKALAFAYASEGAKLVINARSEEKLHPVAEEAQRLGAEVLAVPADVADSESVDRLVSQAADRFGRIDVLVNNAGLLGPRVKIEEFPEDEWRRVMDANLTGLFLVSKAAVPHLAPGASVINLVSGVSIEGRPEWGAYSVSKFGVEGLTQIMSAELEDRGVRVNAVDPGGMNTEMRADAYSKEDARSRVAPEDNVDVFLYLASDESKDVTGRRFKAQEFTRG